jgi:ribosomal protein S4
LSVAQLNTKQLINSRFHYNFKYFKLLCLQLLKKNNKWNKKKRNKRVLIIASTAQRLILCPDQHIESDKLHKNYRKNPFIYYYFYDIEDITISLNKKLIPILLNLKPALVICIDNTQLPFIRKIRFNLPYTIIITIFEFIVQHKKKEVEQKFKTDISFFQIFIKQKNYYTTFIREIDAAGTIIFCLVVNHLQILYYLFYNDLKRYYKVVLSREFIRKRPILQLQVKKTRKKLRKTIKNYILPFLILIFFIHNKFKLNKRKKHFKKRITLIQIFRKKIPLDPFILNAFLFRPYRKHIYKFKLYYLIKKYHKQLNKKELLQRITSNHYDNRIHERLNLVRGYKQTFLLNKHRYIFPALQLKLSLIKNINNYNKFILNFTRTEIQLNILLLRLFFVTSVSIANYLIIHEYVYINTSIITNPMYIAQPNDLIFISASSQYKLYNLRIFINQTLGFRKRLTKSVRYRYYWLLSKPYIHYTKRVVQHYYKTFFFQNYRKNLRYRLKQTWKFIYLKFYKKKIDWYEQIRLLKIYFLPKKWNFWKWPWYKKFHLQTKWKKSRKNVYLRLQNFYSKKKLKKNKNNLVFKNNIKLIFASYKRVKKIAYIIRHTNNSNYKQVKLIHILFNAYQWIEQIDDIYFSWFQKFRCQRYLIDLEEHDNDYKYFYSKHTHRRGQKFKYEFNNRENFLYLYGQKYQIELVQHLREMIFLLILYIDLIKIFKHIYLYLQKNYFKIYNLRAWFNYIFNFFIIREYNLYIQFFVNQLITFLPYIKILLNLRIITKQNKYCLQFDTTQTFYKNLIKYILQDLNSKNFKFQNNKVLIHRLKTYFNKKSYIYNLNDQKNLINNNKKIYQINSILLKVNKIKIKSSNLKFYQYKNSYNSARLIKIQKYKINNYSSLFYQNKIKNQGGIINSAFFTTIKIQQNSKSNINLKVLIPRNFNKYNEKQLICKDVKLKILNYSFLNWLKTIGINKNKSINKKNKLIKYIIYMIQINIEKIITKYWIIDIGLILNVLNNYASNLLPISLYSKKYIRYISFKSSHQYRKYYQLVRYNLIFQIFIIRILKSFNKKEKLNNRKSNYYNDFKVAKELFDKQFNYYRPNNIRPNNIRPNNIRPNNIRPNNIRPNNIRPNNISFIKCNVKELKCK